MKEKKSLLEEAIVEATALKKVAIANAKAALTETFSPKLHSMFEETLNELEEQEEGVDYEELLNSVGSESTFEENLNEYEDDFEDLNEEEEIEDTEEEIESTEGEEEIEDTDEEEEIDIQDMTEEELRAFIEDVVEEMNQAGELTVTEPEMGSEFTDDAVDITGDEEGEVDLEGEEEEEEVFELLRERESKTPSQSIREKNLEKQLQEALKTVGLLKETISTVRLSNAKLLYLNKLYKNNNSLNESQKMKMLESLDKAKTVREAKLIYESLTATLKTSTKPKLKKTPIVENMGSASKPIKRVVLKEEVLADPIKQRFQELAGIVKK